MDSILHNPYRLVGLLVGATAREQERQVKRLKNFIEAEQEPEEDYSFPELGNMRRTFDTVTDAASKLNLDSDKMIAALFWFYNGNAITDEPAFEALKSGDQQSAIRIWRKLIATGEVTQRNNSAFHNLSTLLLCNSINCSKVNSERFASGILLKLKFLESDFVKDLKNYATDETYKTTKKELQLFFLNQVQLEIDKIELNEIISSEFIEIVNKQDFLGKEEFFNKYVQKPIQIIENKIEKAKINRKANKANAVNTGKALYAQTYQDLSQLKTVFRISNIMFSSIADKVSDEILQCGIDYFNYYIDSSTDPGSATMDLFKKAKTLAIGNIAKQRCQENTENVSNWIDGKDDREKQHKIENDTTKLIELIDKHEKQTKTSANARQLLASTRPYLSNLKLILGATDELYLGISTRIASDAEGMCVSEVNKAHEVFNNSDNAERMAGIFPFREKVKAAMDIASSISQMALNQDFRTRFRANMASLSDLDHQLGVANIALSQQAEIARKKGGCYIATMAYGDYDHPQVIILRQFRDNVLTKSLAGRWFIKTYYYYSPIIVEKLKNKKFINGIIRKIINQFIKIITL